MDKEQKGFVVYGDIRATANELTDEQLGKLFRGMIDYFVDGNEPKFKGELKFAFIPIKQQMDRDADKYIQKCEKMRANANRRWNSMQLNANECNCNQLDANDANTNTNTNTNTNKDTNTTTTTNTDTNTNAGGGGDYDGKFDIWNRLTTEDVDAIYAEYPNSGGDLIETVVADVKCKKKQIRKVVPYILGYAKKVNWDDNEEHFVAPWEAAN